MLAGMEDAPQNPDTKTKWAEDRTDWAEDRTVLANERTFAGWMRTAMACVAVALGLTAVFRELQPTWVAKAAASTFIFAALFVIWEGRRTAARTTRRMHQHVVRSQTSSRMTAMAVLLGLASIAAGAILWLL